MSLTKEYLVDDPPLEEPVDMEEMLGIEEDPYYEIARENAEAALERMQFGEDPL